MSKSKFNGKFDVLVENATTRFQSGGLLTGDVVKIRKDALQNEYLASKGENVKEIVRAAMTTDLNIRVSSIRSIRPTSTGNYNVSQGNGTDAPTDYFVDVVIEYAPGLWRDAITLPLEVLEVVDTGINMAPIPDSLKRANKEHMPEDIDKGDDNKTLAKKDTKQKFTAEPTDGRVGLKKPVEKNKKLNKESVELEDVYGSMITEGYNIDNPSSKPDGYTDPNVNFFMKSGPFTCFETKTFESTKEFTRNIFDDEDNIPYVTSHDKRHWDFYSDGNPDYTQYWIFKDWPYGDKIPTITKYDLKDWQEEDPDNGKFLYAMTDSYGDLLDRDDDNIPPESITGDLKNILDNIPYIPRPKHMQR